MVKTIVFSAIDSSGRVTWSLLEFIQGGLFLLLTRKPEHKLIPWEDKQK